MEEVNKKLEELKKEVYYAKHADLSIIDKIDVKVKELEKAIKNHGVSHHVSECVHPYKELVSGDEGMFCCKCQKYISHTSHIS